MLKKKCLTTVIKTIQDAQQTKGNSVFSEENKSLLMDFVNESVDKATDSLEILTDLIDKNYFDVYYKESYEDAFEIARKVLSGYAASKNQINSFIETFSKAPTEDENPGESIIEEETINNENDLADKDAGNTDEITEINKIEEDMIEESLKEQNEDNFEENESEEIEEDACQEEMENNNERAVKNEENDFDGKSSFTIRLLLAIVLFISAMIAVKPTAPSMFYKMYYVIFIAFTLFSIFCCCVAQFDISLLWDFYKNFKNSRGRKEDLKSNNKNNLAGWMIFETIFQKTHHKRINDICSAYTDSFLKNETYNKTRSNADLYFGGGTFFDDMNRLPFQSFLKIIPGTFIGLGILGTFIGFASGLSSINIADSQSLLNGVQNLLDGLKNAFNTSIVGVLAAMFFNFVLIYPLFNKLDRCSKILCDYLDTKFFVSEVDAMSVTDSNNKQIPFPQTMGIVLEKLEQVASNINQMGATVGDQVTQSVKATLDKTIEKIIKEEIKKLKEEMNSSISLLQECQKHLQNAPAHLKEAAEKMQGAAQKNNEIFNNWFEEYTEKIKGVSEEFLNIKNTLAVMPEDFRSIDASIHATAEKLSANQTTLETALTESAQAFDKTAELSESLTKAYESESKKIEEMIAKFTDLLNEYKETSKESKELLAGFKGMDEQIATIFAHINENTKNYSDIIGTSLTDYLNSFTEATKDVSAKFADATDALREEVEKLNKIEKAKGNN